MNWDVVIGLEIHAQLATKSKIFSGASTAYGAEPKTQACEVDIALPGAATGADKGTAGAELTPHQRRNLMIAGGVFMLWSCQYFAYMTWLPQYLVEIHGLSPSMAVVGYVIPVVVLIFTTLAVGLVLRAGAPVGRNRKRQSTKSKPRSSARCARTANFGLPSRSWKS